MTRKIIGIDPGAKGFVCTMDADTREMEWMSMEDEGLTAVADYLRRYDPRECHVVMEEVHALFGASAKSTFAFGETFGYLQGVIGALGLSYTLVNPKVWQKEIWTHSDVVYKTTTQKVKVIYDDGSEEIKDRVTKKVYTKDTSLNAAKRLFPNADWKKNERCRKTDDNKVDATLIAEWGRRMSL